MIVVDASVAVKWFVEEAHSAQASALISVHSGELAGPDLLCVEVSSALVRNANTVKQSRPHVAAALDRFEALIAEGGVSLHRSSHGDIRAAANLAIELGHPIKDCVYLRLAMKLDCPLVTADRRFADKARAIYRDVQVLGD